MLDIDRTKQDILLFEDSCSLLSEVFNWLLVQVEKEDLDFHLNIFYKRNKSLLKQST